VEQIGIEDLVSFIQQKEDGKYLLVFHGHVKSFDTMLDIVPYVEKQGYKVLRHKSIKAKKSSYGITRGRTYLCYNQSDRFYYAFDNHGSTQQLLKENFLVK
jgi:hypothetical protein